jgi:hypothetical protein
LTSLYLAFGISVGWFSTYTTELFVDVVLTSAIAASSDVFSASRYSQ